MTSQGRLPIENPLWEGIQHLIRRGLVNINANLLTTTPGERQPLRTLLALYGPVVPDPDLLAWLSARVGPGVVEVDAGTGYWSWLFAQMGKTVVAFDRKPPSRAWVPIQGLDQRRRNITAHEHLTLFCVLPKLDNVLLALKQHQGRRFVMITDKSPDDHKQLAEALAGEWRLQDATQGICLRDKIYTAYAFERLVAQPLWAMPTVKMSILGLVV